MCDITTMVILALGCIVLIYIRQRTVRSQTSSYPLPPGPPGLPWIGNGLGIDADAPWKTYAEWARTYGDIVYTRHFGKDMIVIHSEKMAKDLLENRSRNYSSRPYFVITALCGLGFSTVLLPYGDRWRLHRQFFHQTFRFSAVRRFRAVHHHKACRLLFQLLDTPEQLYDHIFEYTTSVILNSAYDYDPVSRKDELVEIAENVLNVVVPAFRPQIAVMTGAFPFLLHLPSWLPGMSFKREMAKARRFSQHYLERLFNYSLQRMAGGSVASSMVQDGLQGMKERIFTPREPQMEVLKEASGTAFLAASETSNAVLRMFFLMMALNSAAQQKAQAQIDIVVGTARLPTMDDRPSLPFLDAVLWETLRYNPIVPLLPPHAAVNDDVYKGLHIPKGAILICNIWSMAHDESKFPDSDTFMPERFLNEDGSLKPNTIENIAFGFGRRICVGRHFADTSIWAVIAKVLTVFKILKPLDENGEEIAVEPRFSSGVSRYPLPFGCRIVPRFPGMDAKKLEQLIDASTA